MNPHNDPYVGLYSPLELRTDISKRARARRLALELTQVDLGKAAGVSRSTIARFEQGADIGLDALVKIAFALRSEQELMKLFPEYDVRTIDEMLRARKQRQRTRKKLHAES